MNLSRVGEFGLIERISRAAPKGRGVRVGIGDDAAWLNSNGENLLLTTDLLIEGVHFDLSWTSFYALGYKTLAVSLSDIAAMGGRPAYLTLSLAIPVDFRVEDVEEFYRGILKLASRSGVSLVGGDTSRADRLYISAALIGRCPWAPVTRGGARAGDDIYVTGTLGDSALGLDCLRKGGRKRRTKAAEYLIARHRLPTARLKAGALLARKRLARAMIDVSDGLAQDLKHICEASGVGAVIWEQSLPLSSAYRSLAGRRGTRYAVTGGEDYELLFCARPSDRNRLEKLKGRLGVPITRIGQCVGGGERVKVLDRFGKPVSYPAAGHDHFRTS